MSDEESPDLTKSWVFVDTEQEPTDVGPSGVEEVSENETEPQGGGDSDTDSISVISESGGSYKTDEEEFIPATATLEENVSTPETQPPEPPEPPRAENESRTVERLLYFATSAVCALILIGFSVLVQHYFYGRSDVNKFAADLDQQQNDLSLSPYVKSVKSQDVDGPVRKTYSFKRKTQMKFEGRDKRGDLHERMTLPSAQIENNDLRVEDDVNSNYKVCKNKSPATRFNKENCDGADKRTKNVEIRKKIQSIDIEEVNREGRKFKKHDKTNSDESKPQNDENYSKKLKELKMKENYLREKEKFLNEKEHDLRQQEIKLNKGKYNYERDKHENKGYQKRDKNEYKQNSDASKEKREKFKREKKYFDESSSSSKKSKKYKNKEEKKRYYYQDQRKIIDDNQHKKRNMSGQWYLDLHKARNNIRQKEHASDWVFDRAHLRSIKRNKAHWYFQWMVDRARLRVK